LCQGIAAFGHAHKVDGFLDCDRLEQGVGVGKADVLGRHPDHAPRQIARVNAAVEHAHHPVERGIRVRAPHRLDERGDHVVVEVAVLVMWYRARRGCREDVVTRHRDESALSSLAHGVCRRSLESCERNASVAPCH